MPHYFEILYSSLFIFKSLINLCICVLFSFKIFLKASNKLHMLEFHFVLLYSSEGSFQLESYGFNLEKKIFFFSEFEFIN